MILQLSVLLSLLEFKSLPFSFTSISLSSLSEILALARLPPSFPSASFFFPILFSHLFPISVVFFSASSLDYRPPSYLPLRFLNNPSSLIIARSCKHEASPLCLVGESDGCGFLLWLVLSSYSFFFWGPGSWQGLGLGLALGGQGGYAENERVLNICLSVCLPLCFCLAVWTSLVLCLNPSLFLSYSVAQCPVCDIVSSLACPFN